MGYDSDDDDDSQLVDEEELSAFVARHGFVESGNEEEEEDDDDGDEQLLLSVQEQVGRIFSQKSPIRAAGSEEDDEDEAVLRSLGVFETSKADSAVGKEGALKSAEKSLASKSAADGSTNAGARSDADDFIARIKAGNCFLFDGSSAAEDFPTEEQQETQGLDNNAQLLEHALDKNRKCQELLRSLLHKVEAKKRENAEVQKRVKTLQSFEKFCKRTAFSFQGSDARFVTSLARLSNKKQQQTKGKRKSPTVRGPELNKDVEVFRKLHSSVKLVFKDWSVKEDEELRSAVRTQVQQHLLVQAMEATLMDVETDQTLESREEEINNLSDAEVRNLIDVVDWDAVSKGSLPGRTGKECKARWLNHVDKLINHGPWSKAEDLQLLSIAKDHGFCNWESVAEKLGTYRTAAQCLMRYQRSLNANLWQKDWTPADDEQLRSVVEMCGEKDWETVAACLEGRTGPQVMNRWLNVVKNVGLGKRGRWSIDEDKRLQWAVLICGAQQWKSIAKHVPGRTHVQCRERWRNVLDPQLKFSAWSEDEDKKLEQAVESIGQHRWASVAEVMKPRTDNQCWRRWMSLHPESKQQFHEEVVLKKTLLPTFGKRTKEKTELKASDILSVQTPEESSQVQQELLQTQASKTGRSKKRKKTGAEEDEEGGNNKPAEVEKPPPRKRTRKTAVSEKPPQQQRKSRSRTVKKAQPENSGANAAGDEDSAAVSEKPPQQQRKRSRTVKKAQPENSGANAAGDEDSAAAAVKVKPIKRRARSSSSRQVAEGEETTGRRKVIGDSSAAAAGDPKQNRAARMKKMKAQRQSSSNPNLNAAEMKWEICLEFIIQQRLCPPRKFKAVLALSKSGCPIATG